MTERTVRVKEIADHTLAVLVESTGAEIDLVEVRSRNGSLRLSPADWLVLIGELSDLFSLDPVDLDAVIAAAEVGP